MKKISAFFCKRPSYEILISGSDGAEHYGISAAWKEERVMIADITTKKKDITELLQRLRRGNVPPLALRDVVEDWLER